MKSKRLSFLKFLDSEDTNDENHKASGEWDGRRRSAAAAAASRRRAKQKREAIGGPQGMGGPDTNHGLSSMANKPPQDRPDAKHHLKVELILKQFIMTKKGQLQEVTEY